MKLKSQTIQDKDAQDISNKQQAYLVVLVVFDVMVGALIKCTRASAVTLTNHPPRTRMPNKALTNTVNYFDKYMYQLQL